MKHYVCMENDYPFAVASSEVEAKALMVRRATEQLRGRVVHETESSLNVDTPYGARVYMRAYGFEVGRLS